MIPSMTVQTPTYSDNSKSFGTSSDMFTTTGFVRMEYIDNLKALMK